MMRQQIRSISRRVPDTPNLRMVPSADRILTAQRPSPWPLMLCLVGLDYFSTLAYLPSIAYEAAGPRAPLAAGFVVLATFLLAVPVYYYVVERSPHGHGATALVERTCPGLARQAAGADAAGLCRRGLYHHSQLVGRRRGDSSDSQHAWPDVVGPAYAGQRSAAGNVRAGGGGRLCARS